MENESAFLAMFGNDYANIALLGNALAIASGWKNVFYFMDGEYIPQAKHATTWISCFRGSNYAQDLRAHCTYLSYWQFEEKIVVPCKYIGVDVLDDRLGTSLKDKVISEAFHRGVLGCPHLKNIINSITN